MARPTSPRGVSPRISETPDDEPRGRGWPTAVPAEQGRATIRRAWDRGVRYVDTAPFYGTVNPVVGATYNYAPAEPRLVKRAQRLEAVCREFGVPLRAAALQFPLAHAAVACVLVGARSPEEIDDNLEMLGTQIPGELWATMRTRGLIRRDAPIPGT